MRCWSRFEWWHEWKAYYNKAPILNAWVAHFGLHFQGEFPMWYFLNLISFNLKWKEKRILYEVLFFQTWNKVKREWGKMTYATFSGYENSMLLSSTAYGDRHVPSLLWNQWGSTIFTWLDVSFLYSEKHSQYGGPLLNGFRNWSWVESLQHRKWLPGLVEDLNISTIVHYLLQTIPFDIINWI